MVTQTSRLCGQFQCTNIVTPWFRDLNRHIRPATRRAATQRHARTSIPERRPSCHKPRVECKNLQVNVCQCRPKGSLALLRGSAPTADCQTTCQTATPILATNSFLVHTGINIPSALKHMSRITQGDLQCSSFSFTVSALAKSDIERRMRRTRRLAKSPYSGRGRPLVSGANKRITKPRR
jgi:hypothetical protein